MEKIDVYLPEGGKMQFLNLIANARVNITPLSRDIFNEAHYELSKYFREPEQIHDLSFKSSWQQE
jgi:oligoendopeptidase F